MARRRRERTPDDVNISFFESVFGMVGISYTERAVLAVQLPEESEDETRGRLTQRFPEASVHDDLFANQSGDDESLDAKQHAVAIDAATRIQGLLAGEDVELDPIPVDVSTSSEFNQQVYAVVRMISRGEVLTYGEVARRAGEPGGAQAVGRAMAANPIPVIIPCHRVLGANQELVGFSANGGIETKRRMLLAEDCPAVPPSLFDQP